MATCVDFNMPWPVDFNMPWPVDFNTVLISHFNNPVQSIQIRYVALWIPSLLRAVGHFLKKYGMLSALTPGGDCGLPTGAQRSPLKGSIGLLKTKNREASKRDP